MQETSSLIRLSFIPWVIAFFCCLNSNAGVDHGQYLKWAKAATSGDIENLENEKDLRSTTGVPFSPWSAGPGLLMAPLYAVLSIVGLEVGAGLITGYVCVFAFWYCFFHSLRLIAGERFAIVGCLLAAIGSPIGYYCSSISSETYSLALSSFLLLQAIRAWKRQATNTIGIACATSLLLMMRSYLGVFAWPALVCGIARTKKKTFFVVSTVVAIGFAFFQLGIVNYWMTGSWSTNAYSFGDEQFQSFDWSAPFLFAVLFDSFHGWIPSHPLVAFGAVGILILIGDSIIHRRKMEAVFWLVSFAAITINIYVQSCWFYWWLAMPSFGMRGLVLTSLPSIMAIIRLAYRIQVAAKVLGRRQRNYGTLRLVKNFQTLLVTGTVCFAVWGWLHFGAGPTNCITFSDLAVVLLNTLLGWGSWESMVCVGLALMFVRVSDLSDRTNRFWVQQLSCLLLLMFVAICLRQFWQSRPNWQFVFCLSMCTCTIGWISCNRKKLFASASQMAIPSTLLLVSFFFVGLESATTKKIANSYDSQVILGSSDKVFNWPDTCRACLTLQQIPRFQDEALVIRSFFERKFSKEFVERELNLEETRSVPELSVTRNLSFFHKANGSN